MALEALKCFVIAKNWFPGKNTQLTIYRSSLSFFENEDGDVFLSWTYQRVCRSISREYNLSSLIGMFTELVPDGKVAFCFRNPNQELLVNADQPGDLNLFLRVLDNLIDRRYLNIVLDDKYNPGFSKYISVEHFDRKNLDVKHLSTVILENCVLSSMTIDIGNLPISYLSLTGCTINTSQRGFWDWMCMDTISKTLIMFEMNSIGLNALPFEIVYLTKLQTLSVANNNLTYLPHFFCEFKELENLFINDNMLQYLPECLLDKNLNNLNFSNNKFHEFDNSLYTMTVLQKLKNVKKTGAPVCPKLSYLCFYALVDNHVKLERNNLPCSLYNRLEYLFNTINQCRFCHKWTLPKYSVECFYESWAKSKKLIRYLSVPWQSFECKYKCCSYTVMIHSLYKTYSYNIINDEL